MEKLNYLTIIINLIFTIIVYGFVPFVIYFVKKNMTKEYAKKVVIINGITVYIILIILYEIIGDEQIPNMAAAVIWGIIYYKILCHKANKSQPNKSAIDNINKVSINSQINGISIEQFKKEEDTKRKVQKQKYSNDKVPKILMTILIIGIIILLGLLSYVYVSNKISEIDSEMTILENQLKLAKEKNKANEVKLKVYDENIVFVVEGYGNYYYTYEQMKQVTQETEYSYWIYTKNGAIANGYRAWKEY